MGLIAGICSRDQSDVSELLYKMAIKLSHRGNSKFYVCEKGQNNWQSIIYNDLQEIFSLQTSFGIIGRHFVLDTEYEIDPCSDSNNNILLLDGRIFNISQIVSELKREYEENLNNSSILLSLIEEIRKKGLDFSKIFGKIFNLIEGMYAAALIFENRVFLFRDIIGTKPLYLYSGPKYIAFASEKKALWIAGLIENIESLRPGKVVQVTENGFISHFQANFNQNNIIEEKIDFFSKKIMELINNNLLRLNPGKPFYLLLSGGIDSSILATLLKKMEIPFNSLVIGIEKSKDILAAQQVTEFLDLPLETLKFDTDELEKKIPLLIYYIEDREEKKLNIAFPLFYATKYLKEKKYQVAITGQGADEIFGGYERHETQYLADPHKLQGMLWEDVKNLYVDDLQRDDAASMANLVEIRVPYLNRNFIEFCMQIPPSFKINPPFRKYVLRYVGKELGLSEKIFQKPKHAVQFSSGSYDILKKLSRKYGFTKNFALKNDFFSPTQLFIDSVSYLLGFPNIEPKIVKSAEQLIKKLPDSFFKYQDLINKPINY